MRTFASVPGDGLAGLFVARSRHSCESQIAEIAATLIADEVVCAHLGAEIGPTARMPVIDEAGFAHELAKSRDLRLLCPHWPP